ncbi:hypothetical protein niasHT_027636 [Heterodera trifolii]|uniref:NADH dehydrogenase [ubiquinone] 1 beta subcomplex subunit 8 n=1 Tax=Heterodera trifolii TaxID=157864 RepID=A0ABD2K5C6_9BILA
MTLRNDTPMPPDEELLVPHEISLSSPWLRAVAVYMGIACEKEAKEFMLLRSERDNDPRKALPEGRAVTACAINFLRKMRRECGDEIRDYANCFHRESDKMHLHQCRRAQFPMDICADEKLGVRRPMVGYFSKLHVHESAVPPPDPLERQKLYRDYKAEAAKLLEELPEDWKTDPNQFKKYRNNVVFDAFNPTG